MLVLQTLTMNPDMTEVRFVERVFRLRTLGLSLGFFVVASVLYANGASPLTWALLVVDAFIWPHIARQHSLRAADPERAEINNLLIDSAMGGVWIALMRFNLLPSALLLIMLSIDKISVGGWRLLGRAFAVQAATCAIIAAANGLAFQPTTTTTMIVASLPFLFAYPLAISTATFALTRKVRRHNHLLARQSRVDGSTGLLNRSSWEEAVGSELRRFKRGGGPTSLLMIDIDKFKDINDRYGHLAGDEVIRTVAAIISRCIREVDVSGRYGGDEFGIVLAHTGLHAAVVAAERIRKQVADARFDRAPELACTLSIGIAPATREMQDTHAWISHADAALYHAKTMGRNRIAKL